MSRSRREVLIAGTGGIAMLAGCSVLSDPQQLLRVTILNYTESPHQFHLLVEDGGTELVRQYLEVPAGNGGTPPAMETTVALGEMADGTRLNVAAWVVDGPREDAPLTLSCDDESTGDAVTARVRDTDSVVLSGVGEDNSCFSEDFSVANDSTWGENQTES